MADDNGLTPVEPPEILKRLAENAGGAITECFRLPDGSGGALMSMPLPADHWSTQDDGTYEPPPMRFRMGSGEAAVVAIFPNAGYPSRHDRLTREQLADIIRAAGKYAYRASTMKGKEPDLDPDALLQNLVVALLGYWTEDGRTGDEWALPPHERGKRG